MGYKRRSNLAEDIIKVIAEFPWWAGTLLAVFAYLILHQLAGMPLDIHHDHNQISGVNHQFLKILFYFGQFVIPSVFLIGSIISSLKRARKSIPNKAAAAWPANLASLFIRPVFDGHLFLATAVALLSLIVLLTAVYLFVYRESATFIAALTLTFFVSIILAAQNTCHAPEKQNSAGNHFSSSSEESQNFAYENTAGEERESSFNDQQTGFNFSQAEQDFHQYDIPLEHYLNLHNFHLTDEILESIEWKRFELLCHLIFQATGYNSSLTGDGADQGVDIRIHDQNEPDKILYLVQCKKWKKGRKIDRTLIQQLLGQMTAEKVDKGGFCSTSAFTSLSIEFAAKNNIELFDQPKIQNSLNNLNSTVRREILSNVLKDDYWTPSCASCGEKMQLKKTKNGKTVWSCGNLRRHGWVSLPYFEAKPINHVR